MFDKCLFRENLTIKVQSFLNYTFKRARAECKHVNIRGKRVKLRGQRVKSHGFSNRLPRKRTERLRKLVNTQTR